MESEHPEIIKLLNILSFLIQVKLKAVSRSGWVRRIGTCSEVFRPDTFCYNVKPFDFVIRDNHGAVAVQ